MLLIINSVLDSFHKYKQESLENLKNQEWQQIRITMLPWQRVSIFMDSII